MFASINGQWLYLFVSTNGQRLLQSEYCGFVLHSVDSACFNQCTFVPSIDGQWVLQSTDSGCFNQFTVVASIKGQWLLQSMESG